MLEIINIPWTEIALGLYIAALIVGGLLFLRECEDEETAPLEEDFEIERLNKELINTINKININKIDDKHKEYRCKLDNKYELHNIIKHSTDLENKTTYNKYTYRK